MADANMAYDAKKREVNRRLRQLEDQLDKHERRQKGRPTDKTFIDELNDVAARLDELMRELG
jgi:sugar-specific transcriptional regulator TrmB